MLSESVTSAAGEAQENRNAMFLGGAYCNLPLGTGGVRTRRLGSVSLVSCQGPGLGHSTEPTTSNNLCVPGSIPGPSCAGTQCREQWCLSRHHQPARQSTSQHWGARRMGSISMSLPKSGGQSVSSECTAFYLAPTAPSPTRVNLVPFQKASDHLVTSY